MAEVQLSSVNKIYPGGVHAVRDASVTVSNEEFVVLVGPSGCGKSTLLRMVAGLETLTSGEIRIGGRVVNNLEPKDRDIAMVFQSYALYPHMNVFDNMALGLKLRKIPKAEIEERVGEAARILGIETLLDRKPRQLSGGQRQRVAVGRAIVRKPQVFLFDEPLSNLDAKKRVQTRAEISQLHRRLRATIIYVTHDQVEAMTMGQRIVVMRDGVVQQIGTPLEVYHAPANRFVAEFIGSPPMNFLRGRWDTGGELQLRAESGAAVAVEQTNDLQVASNQEIDLGIRPEHLHPGGRPPDWRSAASCEGDVSFIELLGGETLLHVSLDPANTWIVSVKDDPDVQVGMKLRLWIDLERVQFFSSQSGEPTSSTRTSTGA